MLTSVLSGKSGMLLSERVDSNRVGGQTMEEGMVVVHLAEPFPSQSAVIACGTYLQYRSALTTSAVYLNSSTM